MGSNLITAMDIALRDKRASVAAWIRWKAGRLQQEGRLTVIWDGVTCRGDAVEAFVNRSRWIALCPICNNAEYVDPDTPIFYCLRCGNGNDTAARPVLFPAEREQIEALLLRRPVLEAGGNNRIELLLHAREGLPGLPRSWAPGVSVETLETENTAGGV